MIETVLGTIFGGAFRLAPEVLKWLDKDKDRKHELAMFDKQLELDRMRSQANIDQLNAQAAAAFNIADLQALAEVSKVQGQQTGVWWVDAANTLIRPIITFWHVIVLYSLILGCKFWYLMDAKGETAVQAVISLGQDHSPIVSAILSFWFMDRSLLRGAGK